MSCLTEEQLDRLASGQLGDTVAEPLMDHIRQCAECAHRFEEAKANATFARQLQAVLPGSKADSSDSHRSASHPGDGQRKQHVTYPPVGEDFFTISDGIPGYQIIREIHRGGQGVVYEAIQQSTNRTVAIKVILDGPFASERSRWRFEREVKLVARLKHPNIVVIHDSGIAESRYYFVMDYVRGQPLDTHLRLSKLSIRDIVRLFAQLCDAVDYAHRRGIIHRDLKPSNILVGQDNAPQVLDFGLAKIMDDEDDADDSRLVTVAGQMMGTVRYMSPEQTMGDPDGIDTRTDVYALGVILYELLTDIAPYPTNIELTEAIKNIREFDPCRPSKLRKEINTDLDAIVLKAMSKEPARRYLSAGELGEDLLAWLDGRPVSARSTSSFYVIRKLAFRHGFETLVVATLILIIVGFSAISLENYVRAQNALEQKATSDRAVVTMQSQQDTLLNANHYPFVRRLKLGWFLLEWREGRIDEARRIQSLTAADAPEYKAMAFLLGDSNDVDQLRAALRPKEQSLADFVVGERAAKAGRIDEAIEAFEACANTAGDDLLQQPAKARLTQLRSQIKANANNAPATGDS